MTDIKYSIEAHTRANCCSKFFYCWATKYVYYCKCRDISYISIEYKDDVKCRPEHMIEYESSSSESLLEKFDSSFRYVNKGGNDYREMTRSKLAKTLLLSNRWNLCMAVMLGLLMYFALNSAIFMTKFIINWIVDENRKLWRGGVLITIFGLLLLFAAMMRVHFF